MLVRIGHERDRNMQVDTYSKLTCRRPGWKSAFALPLLLTGFVSATLAVANGDRLYLDCPCTIESDGTTLRVAAGVRSFRSIDS